MSERERIRMKNLFIVKRITHDKTISDEAFTVWCGLRNIMQKDVKEYFVSFNMIACSVFDRVPNRYELEAIKKGYKELVEKEYIKEIVEFSKTEHKADLSALYFGPEQEYFCDLSMEEMHKIMSIDCGRHSKYKLLRYFTCQVGSFNRSKDMVESLQGKIGGMGLDYFTELMPITKPTVIAFNEILEKNEILFIIRHKDFFQYINWNMMSEVREIPNTYSRWEDKGYAQKYAEETHGYKYFKEEEHKRTVVANNKRSLAKKLKYFQSGREYDIDTISELYAYADDKNNFYKKTYEEKMKNYNDLLSKGKAIEEHKPVEKHIDMSIFDDYLLQFKSYGEWKNE